jgi:hypothetical protein
MAVLTLRIPLASPCLDNPAADKYFPLALVIGAPASGG